MYRNSLDSVLLTTAIFNSQIADILHSNFKLVELEKMLFCSFLWSICIQYQFNVNFLLSFYCSPSTISNRLFDFVLFMVHPMQSPWWMQAEISQLFPCQKVHEKCIKVLFALWYLFIVLQMVDIQLTLCCKCHYQLLISG